MYGKIDEAQKFSNERESPDAAAPDPNGDQPPLAGASALVANVYRKSPTFQFYSRDDWLCEPNVMAMTLEERGAYWTLVSVCWLEGELSTDLAHLARMLKISSKRMHALWPAIAPCFRSDGSRLTHPVLDVKRAEQLERSAKMSKNGKKGGRGRKKGDVQATGEVQRPQQSQRKAVALQTESRVQPDESSASASASASALASAFAKKKRSGAVRAQSPDLGLSVAAPRADAGPGETAPLVVLPPHAERLVSELYALATPKRQLDVKRQLYDAIDPHARGARIRKGVHVKARDAAHLDSVCRQVLFDPPREYDAAIVVVLRKLQDPAPGPSLAEVAAQEDARRRALEEEYGTAARSAGLAWAQERPNEYEDLRKPIDAQFAAAGNSIFARQARNAALASATAKAAGFPTFDAWIRGRSTRSAPAASLVT